MNLLHNKKAEQGVGDDILFPRVIFAIIAILFFTGLFFFVFRASSGALNYEKVYTKQIILLIEKAKPDSEIFIDFKQGFEIANKQNKNLDDLVIVNNENKEIFVSLTNKGGYVMNYFTDYNIKIEAISELNKLKIIVSKNV